MYIAKYAKPASTVMTAPQRASQQVRVHFLLGVRIERLLHRHVYQVEEIEQANPGNAGDEVGPAQNYAKQRITVWRMKQLLKESQTDGEMHS
jgi:hypothetical protein